jgi:predicted membrane-bound dolichyl-phosphate-mannose-protein mannosyltransferase
MELINKSDLQYDSGYMLLFGSIVAIDREVVRQYNKVERLLQIAKFKADNKEPLPTNKKPYEFVSEHYVPAEISAETPLLDQKVKEGIAMVEELKLDTLSKAIQKYINEELPQLWEFINADRVLVDDNPRDALVWRIDAKTLGNILQITPDDLVTAMSDIMENLGHDLCGVL